MVIIFQGAIANILNVFKNISGIVIEIHAQVQICDLLTLTNKD